MAQLDKAFQVKPASRDLVRNLSRSDVCRLIPLTEDIRYSWWLGDNNNNRKPPMAEKDYIAMWYHARKPYGINDTIYWGWYDPDTNSIDWQTWQHADADGMAGFANILRPMGYPCSPLPVCNETKVPGSLVYSSLSNIIAERMVKGDKPFYWFYPMNVRGATGIKTESFNQVSGVYMLTDPVSTPESWQSQMRQRFKAKQHWANWKLANIGKYVGYAGVKLIYRLTSGKQFYMGNCSNMGSWPFPGQDNPPKQNNLRLIAVAPGTANYPISATMTEWYGQLTLTLKMHPHICPDQQTVRDISDAWRDALLTKIQ
ncbi:MAG: hypothetical protein CMH97_02970 [Oceanospirillaceae bacterium]|nr:hypothetical protein [Oceanospirillaceae bacterium]|tara:strand:+ start:13312 stop:14253 length:942 start_codon:yes stop_codon:yes gene_type:complete